MKLLSKELSATDVMKKIEERLKARGLWNEQPSPLSPPEIEPRVDPVAFNVSAMEEHADSTRGVPIHSHRDGLGRIVVLAKWAFRQTCQVLINETLGRQKVFNGHVRDAYAQMSAELIRLREEVEQLKAQQRAGLPSAPSVTSTASRKPRPRAK